MPPKQDKQQLAKELYFHTDKSQQEIAEILDINRKTLYLWIRHGRWEEMKIAARQAPDLVNNNIYNYLDQIDLRIRRRPEGEQCPTLDEVNMICRLVKTTYLIDRRSTGSYMQAFEELMKFLNKEDHELAKKVIRHADRYVKGFLDNARYNLDVMEKENLDAVKDNLKRQDEERKADLGDETDPEDSPAATSPSSLEFLPGNERSSGVRATPCTSPSPLEFLPRNERSSGVRSDGATWGNDGAINPHNDMLPKAATDKPHEENDNASLPQNTPQNIFSENGALPSQQPAENDQAVTDDPAPVKNSGDQLPPENCQPQNAVSPAEKPNLQPVIVSSVKQPNSNQIDPVILSPAEGTAAYYASLPPAHRPSPFREGNILWINSMDDIDDDKRKMGDTIRYYPGMDPNEKSNKRACEMRIASEEKDREEKGNAKAIRDAELNKFMNLEIYNDYKDLLKYMTTNLLETVIVRGKEVNKLWFQHNLCQMTRPIEHRNLLTEQEFLRHQSIEATVKYMRRTD